MQRAEQKCPVGSGAHAGDDSQHHCAGRSERLASAAPPSRRVGARHATSAGFRRADPSTPTGPAAMDGAELDAPDARSTTAEPTSPTGSPAAAPIPPDAEPTRDRRADRRRRLRDRGRHHIDRHGLRRTGRLGRVPARPPPCGGRGRRPARHPRRRPHGPPGRGARLRHAGSGDPALPRLGLFAVRPRLAQPGAGGRARRHADPPAGEIHQVARRPDHGQRPGAAHPAARGV